MKKRIMGLALTGVMAVSGVTAFAANGAEVQNGNSQRAEQRSERSQFNMSRNKGNAQRRQNEACANEETAQANREARFSAIAESLEAAGKTELASKIQSGEFSNMRQAIETLSEEERLEIRELMRELNLNGNALGNGAARRDGSKGFCAQ